MDDGCPEIFLLRSTCPEDFQGKQQEGLKTKGEERRYSESHPHSGQVWQVLYLRAETE